MGITRVVHREILLVFVDLPVELLHFEISHFSHQAGIASVSEINCVLIPGDRAIEVFLLVMEKAETFRQIHILRLGLMLREDFVDLLHKGFVA